MARTVAFMKNTSISFRNRLLMRQHIVNSDLQHELFILSIMRCCYTPF
jgi:hypothetical protein